MIDEERHELPAGWVWTTLGEIRVNESRSINPKKTPDQTFELYSVPSFNEGKPEILLGEQIGSSKRIVEEETVLLCKINPRINRTWVVGSHSDWPKIASTEWIPFSKVEGILSEYLCYFMRTDKLRDFLAMNASGVGGSLMRVKPNTLADYPFPLAPFPEQQRIVTEIEKQLTRLDAGLTALKRAQANLQRYKAAVLKAACEGRLVPTEAELARAEGRDYEPAGQLLQRILAERRVKWKQNYRELREPDTEGLPELPGGWCWATVEQLAAHEPNSITDGPFGSKLKTAHYTDSGPRVIRLQNIGDGEFRDEEAHIGEDHFDTLRKHEVFAGDLVVAALGSTLPRACIIPEFVGLAVVKADCIRFKPHPSLADARYLNVALNSEPLKKIAARIVHGIGRPRLNQQEIRALPVPLPPLREEYEFVTGTIAATLQRIGNQMNWVSDQARQTIRYIPNSL